MPHKGASTQRNKQQVLAKPHHQPSNRAQQAREKLKQKAKINSRVYIQLGRRSTTNCTKNFYTGSTSDSPFTWLYWTIQ